MLAPALTGVIPAAAVLPIPPRAGLQLETRAEPSGPVSIIVSTGDQQVVVLRNGVEIGRAQAEVQQQMTKTQVMTLTGGTDKEWIQVGVPDLTDQRAEIITPSASSKCTPRRVRQRTCAR